MFLIPPFLLSIIIYGSAVVTVTASSVDDQCSNDIPCGQSDSDSFFCDFQIGATSGGYCVACEGRHTSFCREDQVMLSEAARIDCEEKCALISCPEPCAEGYFCTHVNYPDGPCQPCETLVVHPDACALDSRPEAGLEACMETCPPRACSKRRHCLTNDASTKFFCNFASDDVVLLFRPDDADESDDEEPMGTCEPCAGLKSTDGCSDRSSSELGSQECMEVCEAVIVTSCDTNDDCTKDRFFCNDNSTVCEECPSILKGDWHVDQCFDAEIMSLSDAASQNNCAESCHTECLEMSEGFISVEGLVDISYTIPMRGSQYASVSGPLVNCQLGGAGECPADAPDDFVCLVKRGVRKFSDKVLNCEESGGIATINFNTDPTNKIGKASVRDAPIETPVTTISYDDGLYLLEKGLGLETKVDVKKVGNDCNRGCSDRVPCPSSPGSWYCDYDLVTQGYCKQCGLDDDEQRVECFLSGLSLKGAQECADTCESTLAAPSCKICGKGISGGSLQSAAEDEAQCNFCPDGLKKSHFDREIPFIGSNATCFKLNQFFLNYQIAENDDNCQLALNFNYICDCEGPGYAGANSDAKRRALVWMPRVSGIVSFLSSSAIIVDVVRDKKKRKKLYGQLMLIMSVFDLMGSAAYSLTTLPIPKEYFIEGSKGSDATCTAQGFFIQMGTIAAFINVSLAVYFYWVIKLSWTETKIRKFRLWLFLSPITVGLTFAFAGIPFYDMLFLWCNNSAAWWPEIPIVISIIVTTCIMVAICWDVYKTEKATRQYSRRNIRDSMTSMVFWQSIWYLLSFYITWPPYLALQYIWAAGNFPPYGFTLFASTMVPLQGFWNAFVFFRVRAKKQARQAAQLVSSGFSTRMSRVIESGMSFRNSQDQKDHEAESNDGECERPAGNPHDKSRNTSVLTSSEISFEMNSLKASGKCNDIIHETIKEETED